MKHLGLLLLTIFAATIFTAYGQQQPINSIPADKKEIIDRFLAGTLDPSYTPALFFGHFGNGKKLGEGALKAHLSLFLKGGADILKVQTEHPFDEKHWLFITIYLFSGTLSEIRMLAM